MNSAVSGLDVTCRWAALTSWKIDFNDCNFVVEQAASQRRRRPLVLVVGGRNGRTLSRYKGSQKRSKAPTKRQVDKPIYTHGELKDMVAIISGCFVEIIVS